MAYILVVMALVVGLVTREGGKASGWFSMLIATCNDDWASAGSNIKMVDHCDVVFIQEGKRADYRQMLSPVTYGVLQDTSSMALAGSAIVWRKDARLHTGKGGFTFGVKAAGLLARWIAWLRAHPGGRKALLISAHRPPQRSRRWWHAYDLRLAARCRMAHVAGRLVILGTDSNEAHHQRLARMCGLAWHSNDPKNIDGFLLSKQIEVVHIKSLPKGTSDHHPLQAEIRFRTKTKAA